MKKTFLTLALVATAAAAFAQGKITLGNDAAHLFVYTNNASYLPVAVQPRAGLPVGQVGTANDGWSALTLQLYAGTSSSSLSLATTLVGANIGQAGFADGRMKNATMTLGAGLPGNQATFFQILVWQTAAGSYGNAVGTAFLSGSTPVFSAVPGTLLNNAIYSHASPALSTWADAPVILSAVVPEPSSIALAGLGAASLLLFRRRK